MHTPLGIGDFSRMTFLSVKALRHYHDIGLLQPADVDPETGYRRYDVSQVPTAQVIRRLRELGMSLDEVRVVMDAPDVPARNDAISAHLRRMEDDLAGMRATVRALRMLLEERTPPSIAVEYRVVGPADTLALRGRLDYADAFDWLAIAFADLRAAVGERRSGSDFALYSSELLEEEHGELVAAIPVEADAPACGCAERLELGRVEYAIAVHEGPLDDIDRTYRALGTVVAERAIGVQGPIREAYLVGALDTPDEAHHRTEVCWPVFQTVPTV
jgi:DNA-binding transcriptional MerR regulator/effector-binding domain-containing protein